MSAFDFDVIGDPPPARRIVPPGQQPPAAATPAARHVPNPPRRADTRPEIEAAREVAAAARSR